MTARWMVTLKQARAHLVHDVGGYSPTVESACGKFWPLSYMDTVLDTDPRCKRCLAVEAKSKEGKR